MAPRCPGSSVLVWLLLLVLAPALALAQASATPPSPWLELARETGPGQTLAILTTDGRWHEGRLAGFSEAGVDLDVDNARVQLADAGRTVMGKTEPAAFVRTETLPGGDDRAGSSRRPARTDARWCRPA